MKEKLLKALIILVSMFTMCKVYANDHHDHDGHNHDGHNHSVNYEASHQPGDLTEKEAVLIEDSKLQSDTHILGDVKDAATDEHLAFVAITVKGTTLYAETDLTGHYFMKNLPTGKYTVIASSMGYKSQEKEIELGSDETYELDFVLEEDAVLLDNVVVSANRSETKRREAGNIVSVLSPKVFEFTTSLNMAEGLNFQPGVRVENTCNNCGSTSVKMNGLDGPYTQVLIDSRPLFSALAGVYGLEHIPASMVERVEVVRGGGSALFGSNAIAGTINVITKEPTRNTVSISEQLALIGGKAIDNNTSFNAAIVSNDYKAGVSLYGNYRYRQAYDDNNDGYSDIAEMNSHNLGFNAYYKTSLHSKLSVEYHNMHEYRRGGDSLMLPPSDANIAEMTEHNGNMGTIKFNWFSPDAKHNISTYGSGAYMFRKSYYGAEKDPNAYGQTEDITALAGLQYVYSMEKCWFLPANLTVGAEFSYNNLKDYTLAHNETVINGTDTTEVRVTKPTERVNQDVFVYSVFAQNEWKNDMWTFLLGLRMDKHSMIEIPVFSPRVNFRVALLPWFNIRAGYAMGFRAPQVFDEDLHISSVSGEFFETINDPNLKQESSHSANLSFEFAMTENKVKGTLLIDGFYTRLNDVFVTSIEALPDGSHINLRTNGGAANVYGVTIEGMLMPLKGLEFQLGFTAQQAMYTEEQSWAEPGDGDIDLTTPRKDMYRSPNFYGYITANYSPIKPLTISVSGVYTGPMWVGHAKYDYDKQLTVWQDERTPNFFDLGIKVGYDFYFGENSKLNLSLGVKNVINSYQTFDTGMMRDAGYVYGPSLPRTYTFALKYTY